MLPPLPPLYDHAFCTGPCAHGQCVRCGYRPWEDKASTLEHAQACRYRPRPWTGLEYTATPGCSARAWHHNETWCDVCKGVA